RRCGSLRRRIWFRRRTLRSRRRHRWAHGRSLAHHSRTPRNSGRHCWSKVCLVRDRLERVRVLLRQLFQALALQFVVDFIFHLIHRQHFAAHFGQVHRRGLHFCPRSFERLFLQLAEIFSGGSPLVQAVGQLIQLLFAFLPLSLFLGLLGLLLFRGELFLGLLLILGIFRHFFFLLSLGRLVTWDEETVQSKLLIGFLIFLVVVFDVLRRHLVRLFLQRSLQFVGQNLHFGNLQGFEVSRTLVQTFGLRCF